MPAERSPILKDDEDVVADLGYIRVKAVEEASVGAGRIELGEVVKLRVRDGEKVFGAGGE